MECVKCGHDIMEQAAFCPYCGEKVSIGTSEEEMPIYQADIKVWLKPGKLTVYRDRVEFSTSSIQKTIFNYSALVSVKKGWKLDCIDFITEDGKKESCPVNRKNIHEAFLYIEKASRPYIAERKKRLLAQGIKYSFVSSTGLTAGILNISDDKAEFRSKSGQSTVVCFQDVKSVSWSMKSLEFSLIDGRTKSFEVDKDIRDEVFSFVKKAIEPYIEERKADLLSRGIYYFSLSRYGADRGTFDVLENRAEFKAKSGQVEAVSFKDVRAVSLFAEMLEFSLTDGTSKTFAVDRDIQNEILSFIENAIRPYVLERTVDFDTAFGIDEQIEINEKRGVFHILRQGGREISEEFPLTAIVKCEQIECSESSGVLDSVLSGGIGIMNRAAKAVGAQNTSDTEEKISYTGVDLTIRAEQGLRTEMVRFGDFPVRISRSSKKYGQCSEEILRFIEYLPGICPECELVVPVLPDLENEPAEVTEAIISDSNPAEEESIGSADEVNAFIERDQFGIAKYIDGVLRFIDRCTTPMTIAIQGSWESGKDSIMKFLSDHLNERDKENSIWFYTWQFFQSESDESLPMRIGKKLITQFSDTNNEELKGRVRLILKDIISIISQGGTDGQNLMDGIFRDNAMLSLEKLTKTFADLVRERTNDGNGKVIIFIDDLGRLAPASEVELLEAMRPFFDCEGCVFIIAADYNSIIHGAEERYGQDFVEKRGKSFFDKIFQVSFRVPASGYDVQNYVKDKLEKIGICSIDEVELECYIELIRHSVGCEPESMDRLFNSFLLLKSMTDEEIYESRYSRLVLFSLLCMQMEFYDVYDLVVRMRDSVTPDFLSGLCSGQSEVLQNSRLSDDEKTEYLDFARVFYDIINTDREEGISETECRAFAEVLEVSSITSK